MKKRSKRKEDSREKPAKRWRKKKSPAAKPSSHRRTCVCCTFPAKAKAQKNGGLFVHCRFCGARYHLNSQHSEIGYALLETRLLTTLAAGDPWFSYESTRIMELLLKNWEEVSGKATPRKTLPRKSEAICPFCGQVGTLSVGKEGKGLPTFGCTFCSVRVFFRSLKGFCGFHVQREGTAVQREFFILLLAGHFNAEITGGKRPLTLEGAETKKEAKKKIAEKEEKDYEERMKFLEEMNKGN